MIFTIWIWLSESGKRRLLWYCGDIFKGMMRWDYMEMVSADNEYSLHNVFFHLYSIKLHNVQASYSILIFLTMSNPLTPPSYPPHQEGNPASQLVRFGVFLWIFSSLHPHSDSSQYKGFPGLESVKTYFQFAGTAAGLGSHNTHKCSLIHASDI